MAEGGKTQKGNLITTLVVALLLTLVGAGVGFAVGVLLKNGNAPEDTATSAQPKAVPVNEKPGTLEETKKGEHDVGAAEEEPGELEPPLEMLKVVPFPPILTTLSDPKGKWVRLEGSVLVLPAGERSMELIAEESGERILTYLRTVRLDQIDSASGILTVRDDLDEMLKSLSNGEVRGVLIHGLVVE